jgi:uncharacterized RDD family membrane protein YckC
MSSLEGVRYAGFWIRLVAMVIDTILLLVVTWPLLLWIYGDELLDTTCVIHGPAELLISWVLPTAALIVLWRYKSATPGKMIVGIRIVDARTGDGLSLGQTIIRFFAYLVSMLPLGFGFLWIAFDPRKQAWHDKLADTVVVRG